MREGSAASWRRGCAGADGKKMTLASRGPREGQSFSSVTRDYVKRP